MTIRRKACIVGAYEHPTRKAPDKTVAQLHAECARGALAEAGPVSYTQLKLPKVLRVWTCVAGIA